MKDPQSPESALQHYFDDLLETDDSPLLSRYADPLEEQRQRLQKLLYSAAPRPDEPATESESQHEEAARPSIVQSALEPETPIAPVPTEVTPEPDRESNTDEELLPEETLPAEEFAYRARDLDWLNNGRPAWAQSRFEVLLFKVAGLTLAVPLVSLGQIHPITEGLTPLFGQADWFMGIQPTTAGKVRTLNTAKFVMPERYDEAFVASAKYVISIDGVPWGLAVDSVNQPVSLDPEDVKWRGERSRRPWLAGTVKEQMCALLDIPRIGQILMEAEARRA